MILFHWRCFGPDVLPQAFGGYNGNCVVRYLKESLFHSGLGKRNAISGPGGQITLRRFNPCQRRIKSLPHPCHIKGKG
ncbi:MULTISPECIES: hypothetical protein [unclassified Brucella]|uniref:hypothetical protein n=1 Tax=unclassified Brucella TaxID=2632610 RepID=UPI0001BD7FBF|nr:predicted protein [Brucella sp. 83/13]